ncbi:MAG: NIPSNAP family protein [Sphingobacteriaceae bacterium]
MITSNLKTNLFSCLLLTIFTLTAFAPVKKDGRNFYQLKIYHPKNREQVDRVEKFLQNAYLPALHKAGIKQVGVFKPISDTAELRIYVFIPFKNMAQFEQLPGVLTKDAQFQVAGKDYIDANYDQAPYDRIESILLHAFPGMQSTAMPKLTAAKKDRVYELRSYEGPTEKYYASKVDMFNKGDEIGLFNRLGFNAVFYAEVVSGSRMPNLMYMTTFNNMADRDARWKTFFDDAHWKKISALPEYQHNVSKGDTWFLYPADYSDF